MSLVTSSIQQSTLSLGHTSGVSGGVRHHDILSALQQTGEQQIQRAYINYGNGKCMMVTYPNFNERGVKNAGQHIHRSGSYRNSCFK